MRELPPLNALRVFDVAARSDSFSQAAQQLHLTQGAVSRQIQSLEQFFGCALFVRHPRQRLVLTAEGQLLEPVARAAFAQIEDVTRQLSRRSSVLALKIPTCAMRWMLPKIMRLRASQPDIDLQLTTTVSHRVDFATEPFDAAVVYGDDAAHGHLVRVPLFAEVLSPVCTPALQATLASVDDLARHTLLHPTRDHADWRRWLDAAGAPQVRADTGPDFETMDLATDAAVQGFGVAISDCLLVADDLASGRLVQPFALRLHTGQHYYLVYPERSASAAKLAHLCQALAQTLPGLS